MTMNLKLALQGTAAECVQGDTAEELAESLVTRFQLSMWGSQRQDVLQVCKSCHDICRIQQYNADMKVSKIHRMKWRKMRKEKSNYWRQTCWTNRTNRVPSNNLDGIEKALTAKRDALMLWNNSEAPRNRQSSESPNQGLIGERSGCQKVQKNPYMLRLWKTWSPGNNMSTTPTTLRGTR